MPKAYKLPTYGASPGYGAPGPPVADERDLFSDPNRQKTQPVGDPTAMDGLAGGGAASTPPALTRRVTGGNLGNTQGYDAGNFGNEDVQTLKYRSGRILSDYWDGTPEGIRRAMQDPRWTGDADLSRAVFDDADKINFGGALSEGDTGVPVNWVDVGQGYENGRYAGPQQWLDQDAMMSDGGGGVSGGGAGAGLTLPNLQGLTSALGELGGGNETMQERIQRELRAMTEGAPSPMSVDALLQQLEGR